MLSYKLAFKTAIFFPKTPDYIFRMTSEASEQRSYRGKDLKILSSLLSARLGSASSAQVELHGSAKLEYIWE